MRLKIRVWSEGKRCEVPVRTGVAKHKYIRQNIEQSRPLFCLLGARLLSLLVWMAHEPLQTLVLLLLLFGVQRMTINGEGSTKRTIVCLDDFLDLFPSGFLFFQPVHPVAVIVVLEFQFVGDYPPCQFISRHSDSVGLRLRKCVRSQQNKCYCGGRRTVYQSHSQ